MTIRDNGTNQAEPRRNERAGTGLAGLSERIAALGGTVVAGRIPEGGFRLVVEIPMPGPAESAPEPVVRGRASGQPFVLGEQP